MRGNSCQDVSISNIIEKGIFEWIASMPNKKMQLTIAKAARLATPSLTSFAIAADL